MRAEDCQNHLHQLHVCLPSREGHTRLLYRMSMDFMDWTLYVPGIQSFWKYIAGQVLRPYILNPVFVTYLSQIVGAFFTPNQPKIFVYLLVHSYTVIDPTGTLG